MWAVDGTDDRSVAYAARLMEIGVEVRIIDNYCFYFGCIPGAGNFFETIRAYNFASFANLDGFHHFLLEVPFLSLLLPLQ